MRKELFRSKRGLVVLLGLMSMAALVIMPLGCGGSSSSTSGTTYTVGGTVSGLSGTVVLQNNAGDDLTVTGNGTFTFAAAVADGAAYNVQVSQQPSGQTCTATTNSGNISGADVVNVVVACANTTYYAVGGNVTGLSGTLVLQNNGGDDLTISADGTFTFATSVADGGTYGITVLSKPSSQLCTVAHNSGFVSGADVTDVLVTCGVGTTITISGSVEDADTGAPLQGIWVDANDPANDSNLSTSGGTDASGNFSIPTNGGQDLYLHANGAAVGSTTYVSQNLQILEDATDQSGIKIYMIPVDMVTAIAGQIGAEATTDAIFALDVASVNDTLITGVTVAASPSIPNILYQQTSPAGAFTTTPPTTDYDSPSVVGFVAAPGANGTYTFTMTGNTTGMTIAIDNPVKLRLIPGEVSMPIEP